MVEIMQSFTPRLALTVPPFTQKFERFSYVIHIYQNTHVCLLSDAYAVTQYRCARKRLISHIDVLLFKNRFKCC